MRKKLHFRYWAAFGFLFLLLILFIIWNINSGSIPISVREIIDILFMRGGEETARNIVWEIRLPRIISAVILEVHCLYQDFSFRLFLEIPLPALLYLEFLPEQSWWYLL